MRKKRILHDKAGGGKLERAGKPTAERFLRRLKKKTTGIKISRRRN
jgi:hypothetical protein